MKTVQAVAFIRPQWTSLVAQYIDAAVTANTQVQAFQTLQHRVTVSPAQRQKAQQKAVVQLTKCRPHSAQPGHNLTQLSAFAPCWEPCCVPVCLTWIFLLQNVTNIVDYFS